MVVLKTVQKIKVWLCQNIKAYQLKNNLCLQKREKTIAFWTLVASFYYLVLLIESEKLY
jgi:hypothetical protein